MAGGTGTRFWPLSTRKKPKQFLDILNTGSSLLQLTFNRFQRVCPTENIFVVTNELYGDLVKEQLPELSDNQVLLEPEKRNTAPCIAYANYKIESINPDANIVVTPSDHLILKESEFIEVINNGLDFTAKNNSLLTLGINPNRPETGYGYIQIDPEVKDDNYSSIYQVKTFTEKPNLELAEKFYESDEYYWNSGVFIWSLKTIKDAFKSFLPDIDSLFAKGTDKYNTPAETDFISEVYMQSNNISIDYGIMEKADNVYVYTSDFGWADLGTWGSLQEFLDKDDQGNSVIGKDALLYDVKNSIINVPKDKLVVAKGLDDYIVVDSDNKLLIYKKEDEQEIKDVVDQIKNNQGNEYI